MRRTSTPVNLSHMLYVIILITILASAVSAANNPGHDSLYVEEQGSSTLNGSLNITANLSVLGKTDAGSLTIYGDGTSPGSGTFIASSAGGTDLLRINAPGNLLLKNLGGGQVVVGSTTPTDLNVTGAIYAYGNTSVCLSNGTGCPTSALGGGNVTGSGSANYVPLWSSSTQLGNSIIWANSTNVGIGTANPAYTLDVAGSTYLHGAQHFIQSTSNVGLRLADGVNTQYMYLTQDAAGSLIVQNGSGNGGEKVTIMQNGNVGIGVTSPSAPVHIKADGSNSQMLMLEDTGTPRQWALRTGSNWFLINDVTAGNKARLLIDSNGNVGIGAIPSAKLDVNNTVDGVGIIVRGVNGQSTNLQEWKNHTGFTYAAITGVDGNAGHFQLNSPVGQSGGAGIDFTTNGAAYTGSVGIDGGGNYVIRQDNGGSMFFDYNAYVFFRKGGANISLTLTDIGLGVGTWPTQKLDVNGSGNFSGTNAQVWVNGSRVCTEANGLCSSAGGSAGGWTNDSTTTSTALDVNIGSSFYFNNSNGRLTMNASQNAPTALVVINANTGGAAKAQITFGQATTGSNYGILEHLGSGFTPAGVRVPDRTLYTGFDTGGAGMGTGNTYPFIMFTNNTERARFDGTTGYLGIGTTAPAYLLDINGTTVHRNAVYLYDDSGVSRGAFLATTSGITLTSQNAGSFIVTGDNNTKLFVVKGAASQSGNLTEWQNNNSIALASVNASGTIFDASGQVCTAANGLCNSGGSAGGWTNTTTTTTTTLHVNVTTGNLTVVGGNVGIGTALPSAKAEIKAGASNGLRLTSNNSANPEAQLYFNGNNNPYLQLTDNAGVVQTIIRSEGNSFMNAGNLGIGTTNPSAPIHVNVTVKEIAKFEGTANSAQYITVQQNNPNFPWYVNFSQSGTTRWTLGPKISTGPDFSIVKGDTEAVTIDFDTNNVGLSTITPTQKLDVNGSGNFSGTNAQVWVNGSRVCTEANGLCGSGSGGGWTNTSTTTSTALHVNVTTGNLTVVNGYVGIGTSTPSYPLDIMGTAIRIDAGSGSSNAGIVLTGRNSGTANNAQISANWEGGLVYNSKERHDFTLNGESVMYLSSAKLIGIGTTNPKQRLDVNGSAFIGVTGTATMPNGNINSSYLLVGDSANTLNIGEIYAVGNTGVTTSSVGMFGFANYNLTTSDKRIGVILGGLDGATNSGNIQFLTWNAGTAGERMRIDKNGNIGIGTTAPTQKLDVNGSILATGLSVVDGSRVIGTDGSYLRLHGTSGVKLTVWDSGYVDALTVAPTSGNVGIGTTAPTQKLDVNGSANFSSANAQVWVNGSRVCTEGNGLCGSGSGGGWTNTSTTTTTALRVNITGPRTTIPAGQLIIGATTAAEVDTPLIIYHNSTSGIIVGRNTDNGNGGSIMLSTNNNHGRLLVYKSDGNAGIDLVGGADSYFNNGNVGIGTTVPTTKLDVNGSMRTTDITFPTVGGVGSPNIFFGNSGPKISAVAGSGSNGYLYIQSGVNTGPLSDNSTLMLASGNSTAFMTNGGELKMTLDKTGNLGIGTSEPSTKLDVNGTFKVTSTTEPQVIIKYNNSLVSNISVDANGVMTVKGTYLALYSDSTKGVYIGPSTTSIYIDSFGRTTFAATGPGYTPVIVQANVGQTANNQEWQNASGTVLAYVNASGAIFENSGRVCTATNGLCGSGSGGGWTNTSTTTSTALDVNITSRATGAVPLTIIGANGQTGNLTEWKNASGSTMISISPTGHVGLGGAPDGSYLIKSYGGYTMPSTTRLDWGLGSASIREAGYTIYLSTYNGSENTDKMVITTDGNVGIGTTAPTQKLDVNGSINISGNITMVSVASIGTGTASNSEKLTFNEAGGTITANVNAFDIYDWGATNGFRIDMLSGDVARFSSAAGGYEFDGSGNFSGTNAQIWVNGSRVCTEANGLCGSTGGSGGGWTNTSTTTSTALNVNLTAGNITLPNNAAYIITGVGGVTANMIQMDFNDDIYIGNHNNAATDMIFYTGTSASFVFERTGNVGIGTTAPTQRLHVNGTANITSTIYVNSSLCGAGQYLTADTNGKMVCSTPSGTSTGNVTGSGTAGNLSYWSNETNLATSNVVYNAGNVGIGTSTPTGKLNVVGNVNVTNGNVTVNTNYSMCFNENCSSRIYYNGTALVIEGQ